MNLDHLLVSVLMPAYKPDYFKEALLSVVGQTHGNMEILVGDNNGNGSIQAVVDAVADPRVVILPVHGVSAGSARINHLLLWQRARGRHVRFVYDDDVLLPRSTEVLLDALQTTPRCVMAWHQRYFIDENSRAWGRGRILKEGARAVLDRAALLDNFINFSNFIGEPSFVLFDREAVSHFDFNRYARIDTAYLWDIAMYLEASRDGLLIGCGDFLGSFRMHGSQVSQGASVWNAVEWELVFRQELFDSQLSEAQFMRAVPRLIAEYEKAQTAEPSLTNFARRLMQDVEQRRLREGLPMLRREYQALRARRASSSFAVPESAASASNPCCEHA